MRWQERRRSENVEDRRRITGPVAAGGGVGVLLLMLVVYFLGGDPRAVLEIQQNQQLQNPGGVAENPAQDEQAEFVKVVLADTEDVWNKLFTENGMRYEEPTLVLFRGRVESACGFASAAVGPFYCPADKKVYLDLQFFEEMSRRLDAAGDFAQAYVVAHEIGHHVQNQLGITRKVDALRGRVSEEEYNQASVRLELQADFFAGVWAHHAERMKQFLEKGDLEEALNAASAIGDDRLQMRARGYTVPESFTHGTSEQRERWFRRGFETGDLNQGDTFKAKQL